MKKITTLLILLISQNLSADIGLIISTDGNLIQPDIMYLDKGGRELRTGTQESALFQFKKAASYGNILAMYYIANIKLKQKKYVEAAAWLALLSNKDDKLQQLSELMMQDLNEKQQAAAKKHLKKLNKQYSEKKNLSKRRKWQRALVGTGTNISGSLGTGSLNIHGGDVKVIQRQVDDFVDNYQPYDSPAYRNILLTEMAILVSSKK